MHKVQMQAKSSSGQAEEQNGSVAAPPPESDESFWCSDDIPVDPKNSLDSSNDNNTLLHCVKPPANLVVLEGDCLDVNGGDTGELETYLLATNDLFRDFILLDASDAVTVDEFLGGKETFNKNKSGLKGGSSIGFKSRKSFFSPSKRSGGTARKSAAKTPNPDQNHSALVDNHFETNDHNMPDYNANMDHEYDMDDGFSQPEAFDDSDEDDDDPWKPLNPHEQGNLIVKPFKKVKAFRKEWSNPTTKISITDEFPLAKLHGPVSAELHEIWEAQNHVNEKDTEPQSPPLYEKLRRSLVIGDHESNDAFNNDKDKHEEDDGYDDGGAPEFDTGDMDEDHFNPEKPMDDATQFDSQEPFEHEDPNADVNLEDLCRSHLDSFLASCTETEKQSALAARVSTWKQRIEKNLDEQDARPPFDIHEYGQRTLDKLSHDADVGNAMTFTDVVRGQEKHEVARTFSALLQLDARPPFDIHEYGQRTLDKLSHDADVGNAMTFTDVVRGQEKHEVARTFSALLQLVNNGNVELIKGGGVNGQFVCYTGENPFHVRLLSNVKRPDVQLRSANKRPKPQLRREKENNIPGTSSSPSPAPSSSQMSVKVGKVVGIRCTPESKRRRRSRLVDPDGLNSVG
nr:condensin-2 complex subunit H2 [Tanacetum cinerariifolium]